MKNYQFKKERKKERKKESGRKSIIKKDIGLKFENLIKKNDLPNLEDIKKVLEKSNDKLVLSKRKNWKISKEKGMHSRQIPLENMNLLKSKKMTN